MPPKFLSHHSHPKLKRKKSKAPWVHAWAFQLAAWNFSSQKTSSPFLAWPNTPCQEHPTNSSYSQLVANKTSHEAKCYPYIQPPDFDLTLINSNFELILLPEGGNCFWNGQAESHNPGTFLLMNHLTPYMSFIYTKEIVLANFNCVLTHVHLSYVHLKTF